MNRPPPQDPLQSEALARSAEALTERVCRRHGVDRTRVRVVVAPYRICPLGAHIDHQGGPVLGMAIDLYSLLAFAPCDGPEFRLASANFPGQARFDWCEVNDPPQQPIDGWDHYARAAAWALRDRVPDSPKGVVGEIWGSLPGCGLSSSASVLIAYLLAFAEANTLELTAGDLVEQVQRAENEYIGLRSGVLDPASIASARRGQLSRIDTRESTWRTAPAGCDLSDTNFLVFSTGLPRNLTQTPFNARVEQTLAAAAILRERSGHPGPARLGELPDEAFHAHANALSEGQRRRAAHFFGERERVERGWRLWQEGDLRGFGRLMFESCRSSIENYQTGSPELIALQTILEETDGVLGARFSGAGFGGCSVALVDAAQAETLADQLQRGFVAEFPELEDQCSVRIVQSVDGVRIH